MTLTPEQIANWIAGTTVKEIILTDNTPEYTKNTVQSYIDANETLIDVDVDEPHVKETPKKFRTGLCVHNVSAKHCRVCK
jgi:hypothetical protein